MRTPRLGAARIPVMKMVAMRRFEIEAGRTGPCQKRQVS